MKRIQLLKQFAAFSSQNYVDEIRLKTFQLDLEIDEFHQKLAESWVLPLKADIFIGEFKELYIKFPKKSNEISSKKYENWLKSGKSILTNSVCIDISKIN